MSLKQQLLGCSVEDKLDVLHALLQEHGIDKQLVEKIFTPPSGHDGSACSDDFNNRLIQLFMDGAFQKKLIDDQLFINGLMQRQDFKEELIKNEQCLASLATNNAFIEKLLKYEFFVKSLGKKEEVTKHVISDICENEEQLVDLLNNSFVKEFILKFDGYVEKLILQDTTRFAKLSPIKSAVGQDKKWLMGLLSDESVLSSLINNKTTKEYISSDEEYVNKLTLNKKFIESFSRADDVFKIIIKILLNNENILTNTLQSELLIRSILENEKFQSALTSNGTLRSLLIGIVDDSDLVKDCFAKKQIEKLQESDESLDTFRDVISNIESFINIYEVVKKHLSVPEENKGNVTLALKKIANGSRDFQNLLCLIFYSEGKVILNGKPFKIIDWRGFWVPFQEIFINKDYDITLTKDVPFIIDAGANIGLATTFIKAKYPLADVICFEPSKSIREILIENLQAQNFNSVKVFPYALSDIEGSVEFSVPHEDNLAGSVGVPNQSGEFSTEVVETKKLSNFLNKKCDFLKLDIEGQEEKVFRDIRKKLPDIDNIFIEYHGTQETIPDGLTYIIRTLTKYNYYFHIEKAFGTDKYTKESAFSHLGKKYSQVIFATKGKVESKKQKNNILKSLFK